MSFPKPLTISSHTLRAVNMNVLCDPSSSGLRSRAGSIPRRAGCSPCCWPGSTFRSLQSMPSRRSWYHHRSTWSTGWSPVRHTATRALSKNLLIGRGPERAAHGRDEALQTLAANTEDAYGFPPFAIMERAITLRRRICAGERSKTLPPCARSSSRSWMHSSNVSVSRLNSPNFAWADIIPNRLADQAATRPASEISR